MIRCILVLFIFRICESFTNDGNNQRNEIVFDRVDLTAKIPHTNVSLEAFAYNSNRRASSASRLKWVSLGVPSLIAPENASHALFHFTPNGFYTFAQTLTKQHRIVLAPKHPNQIVNMPLCRFECPLDIVDEESGRSVTIVGKVTDFQAFPLRLDFYLTKTDPVRMLVEREVNKTKRLNCQIASTHRVDGEIDFFKLSLVQMSNMKLTQRLFEPDENVTRLSTVQIDRLSNDIFTQTRVEQKFKLDESTFRNIFTKEIFKITPIRLDDQLSESLSLSRYGSSQNVMIKLASVKEQLENVFTVKEKGDKSIVTLNDVGIDELLTKLKDLVSVLPLESLLKFVTNKENEWFEENKNLNEQLAEINNHTEKHIEWRLVDEMSIVPVLIRLAELKRPTFINEITMPIIRTIRFGQTTKRFQKNLTLKEPEKMLISNMFKLNAPLSLQQITTRQPEKMITHVEGKHLQSLTGHTTPVTCIALLRNGNLAGGTQDGKLIIWNVQSGQILRQINAHMITVTSLIELSNGFLASGSRDGLIKIWIPDTGKLYKSINAQSVNGLALLPKKTLASASRDNSIKIWNPITGKNLRTIPGAHADSINSLAVLNDGLLASSSDRTIKLWNAESGTLSQTIKTLNHNVISLVSLRSGDLATGSDTDENSIKIWDAKHGTVKRTLKGHTGGVKCLCELNDGLLASGSYDMTVKVWNLIDGSLVINLTEFNDPILAMALLNNQTLAISSEKTLKIWQFN